MRKIILILLCLLLPLWANAEQRAVLAETFGYPT